MRFLAVLLTFVVSALVFRVFGFAAGALFGVSVALGSILSWSTTIFRRWP